MSWLYAALFTEVGTLRLLALIAQPTLLAFPIFLNDPFQDSFLVRIVLAGAFLAGAVASFIPGIRRHARHITHVLLSALVVWAGVLAILNKFEAIYVVSYMTLALFCGLNFKNIRTFAWFAALNGLLALSSFYFMSDFIGLAAAFSGLTLMILVIAFIGLGFRERIERELSRKADMVNSILENSPDAILVLGAQMLNLRQYNKNAERMAGLSTQPDAMGSYWESLLRPIWEARPTGQAFARTQLQITRADGTRFWAEALLNAVDSGRRQLLLCTVTDITARIKAEQSLRLSDHILHEVDHLVMVCDAQAHIIYVSPAVERVLGYPIDSLMGDGWWNTPLRTQDEHDAEKGILIDTLSGRRQVRSVPYERAYRTAQGQICWVQWKDAITHDHLLIAMGVEHTEERHNALLRSVIFNIAEASSKVKSPGEFYQFIHKEIRRVIDTPNFYIAVYDQVKDFVHFPYYADAADQKQPFSRKAGKGLTELTIRSKKPLLASKADIEELDRQGLVQLKGQSIPEVWLGVPLVHDDEVVGLITIQDYTRPSAYTPDDLDLLTFIAAQVAQFVNKLQRDEALRVSEERFRAIYDHSAVGIAQINIDSRFVDVNQRLCEIFGYEQAEITQLSPMDITHPDDVAIGQSELDEIRQGTRDTYTVEKRYNHRLGHVVHARVNVSAYREKGKIRFIISVYEDITQQIRAQRETAMLYALTNALNDAPTVEQALEQALVQIIAQDDWDYGEAWVSTPGQAPACVSAIQVTTPPEGVSSPSLSQGHGITAPDELFCLEESDLEGAEYCRAPEFRQAGHRTVILMPIAAEGSAEIHAALVMAMRRPRDANERGMRVLSAARAQILTFILRKQAELAQKESEERYKAITEAAFEGIAIHRQGIILQANNAFAQLFGMNQEALAGLPILDLAANDESRAKLEQVVSGQGTVTIVGRRQGGEEFHLEAVGRPGTWEGAEAGIVALRDITSEMMIEAARETARLDARFRAYVQNSTEIIMILGEDQRVQYSSPTLERYTGLEPESIVGMEIASVLHPSDVGHVRDVLAQVMRQSGEMGKTGARIATEDGEWRHFQMAFTNLIEDPMVKGVLLSAHDITDLKRSEAAVVENETKFRAIFAQANDAILVLEARRIIECNDMAEEMFGMPRAQLLGTSLVELSPERQPDGADSLQKLHALMGDALDGNHQYFTWVHRRQNGQRFDAEVSMSQISIGDRLHLQCVVRDITERVLAENALRDSERRNKAILDAIPDLMLRINDRGVVLDFKASEQQTAILKGHALIGADILELLPPAIAERVQESIAAPLPAGEGVQHESELRVGTELRDIETRVVHSGNHELLVIIRDVTERKRTEKELIKRNFELDSFVYRASHDLKAPLNSLMGMINVMGSDFEDPMVQNYLKMMNKSVVKLDNFIKDLADFSRNDRMEVERVPIEWETVVKEIFENLKYMETAERVRKELEVHATGSFCCDLVRLGIVLNNLISNAIKYQNLRRDDAYVRVEVQSSPDQAVVRVIDNGIGISEEHIGKVFNLFFRASVQSYGSGMGMYIVKNAVDRLQGTIQLESAYGVGTTITVTIPNWSEG